MHRWRVIPVCLLALGALCPSIAHAEQAPPPLSEVVTTSSDATIEKFVEKLFSNNWIILSANPELGLITFRYQSEENSSPARRHVNVLEGSILVRAETSTSTRVRVKLTLSWQESFADHTFQTGVRSDVPAEWYKLVSDVLGLSTPLPSK